MQQECPTLQDCVNELEKMKESMTKIQKMIVEISDTVLSRGCKD